MRKFNKNNVINSFKIALFIIALLWIILLISCIFPIIKQFGIRPRIMLGLPGIFIAPFLHTGFNHLIANSISLLILGTIFLNVERKLSIYIVMHFVIIGGFGTWLIGRSNFVHIGASGVIYGILGYLFSLGIFTRNIKTIIISLIVFFLYGGAIWGIFPTNTYISWEGHLCGFLSGVLTAKVYSKRNK